MCCAVLSHVQLFATPWTVAHQAPLSMGILQARILEWVAMPSCRASSQPRNQTGVSNLSPALQADSLPAELPGKPKSFQAPQACPSRIAQTLRGLPTLVLTSPFSPFLAPCPVTPHPLPLLFIPCLSAPLTSYPPGLGLNSRLCWNQILSGDPEHTAGQALSLRFRGDRRGMGAGLPLDIAKLGMTDARQDPAPFSPPFGGTPLASLPAWSQCQASSLSWLLSTAGKGTTTVLASLQAQTPKWVPPASTCSSLGSKPLTILGLHHSLHMLPSDPGPNA